ncbi:FliA/WhiG family RNA polymerase sigma factor [Shouchella shacheensis]|uniref:FliA/WhiG family RNA polymerase sigma factor n=1 Tax=Shouchella shacheensis TaxID=1649580 RepID=UPI00073FE80F|nr:FliA/WhiG family RNA polymerase sigma factor [Shouchella shacheensis]
MRVITEATLWAEWERTKSESASEALILNYMPLVHYHVQRISVGLPPSVDKEELLSNALGGLTDALAKFDSTRELKFDTYASFRIRGAIMDGLRKEDRVSRSMRDKMKKMDQTIAYLEQQKGRSVSSQEVAAALEMEEKEVWQINHEQLASQLVSLDEVSKGSEQQNVYTYSLEDTSALLPDARLIEEDTKKELAEVIAGLGKNEQLVIQLCYYEELTLTEIGHILDLSTSRISQIHARAIFKLKQKLLRKETQVHS